MLLREERLKPIIKWAGGKERELKKILPRISSRARQRGGRYLEPFLGGGAVFFSVDSDECLVNDRSAELISLYTAVKEGREGFFDALSGFSESWHALNTLVRNNSPLLKEIYRGFSSRTISEQKLKDAVDDFILSRSDGFGRMVRVSFNVDIDGFVRRVRKGFFSKAKRMRVVESRAGRLPDSDLLDNIESGLKGGFYTHLRHLYNNTEKLGLEEDFRTAVFYFIRNYAYAAMFRYNRNGDFNVPYGGIAYNGKDPAGRVVYLKSQKLLNHLKNTKFSCLDFEEFFDKCRPGKGDFVFLDPPYDSDFSTYAGNEFTRADHHRLADYLPKDNRFYWMMVIKNTDFIEKLYGGRGLNIENFDKRYNVSFRERNDKRTEHLMITNY